MKDATKRQLLDLIADLKLNAIMGDTDEDEMFNILERFRDDVRQEMKDEVAEL